MDHPGSHPLGHIGNPQDNPTIIIGFDDIAVLDSPLLCLLRMNADHDPVVPVLSDPVPGNVCQPFAVGIIVGMIRIARMGSNQLDRIFLGQRNVITFPAWNVPRHGRPLLILWEMLLETLGDEFDLSAIGP